MNGSQSGHQKDERSRSIATDQRAEKDNEANATITTPKDTNQSSKPSSQSRPKDGARTLLDAVTAYQRRTARPRAERGVTSAEDSNQNGKASTPQSQSSNQVRSTGEPPSRPDNQRPTESLRTPEKSSLNQSSRSGKKNNNTGGSEFSRNSNSYGFDRDQADPVDKDCSPDDQRRKVNNSSKHLSSFSHQKKAPATRDNSTIPKGPQSRSLFDPNAKSSARQNGPVQGSTRNVRSDHRESRKPKRAFARGNVGEARQLFDPRKHDPVKFSSSKKSADSEAPPVAILVPDVESRTTARKLPQDQDQGASLHQLSEEEGSKNSLVKNLKQSYKRIVSLETVLKDEEYAAKAKEEELKAREARENLKISQSNVATKSVALLRLNAKQKRIDEEYWVRLAKQHRDLAEAHLNFLELAFDPRLPSSAQGLPQKYSIPQRLWQTAFHQLLERLRHEAIPQFSGSSETEPSKQHLLDHLTDFIYFAYGFYTALLEEQRLLPFKSVWLEQLGDLARYRMAVAGMMGKKATHSPLKSEGLGSISADEDMNRRSREHNGRRTTTKHSRRRKPKRSPDEDSIEGERAVSDSSSLSQSHTGPMSVSASRSPSPEQEKPQQQAPSIGVAALGSWEFEEQEVWRATAKDWYSKGLAETPGSGRLHHHLALLSKGDELRTLYHYCKSLTAASPYLPARESILPFFESEHQSRRSRPEVSIGDLFVHLHGMLFTKIQLDDFDKELARFIERLTEDRLLSEKQHRVNFQQRLHRPAPVNSTISDVSWIIMGVINICALLQYGSEDGIIRTEVQKNYQASQESFRRHSNVKLAHGPSASTKSTSLAPQAILLSHQPSASATTADGKNGHRAGQSSCSDNFVPPNDTNSEAPSAYALSDHASSLAEATNHEDQPVGSGDDQLKGIMIKIPEADEAFKDEEPVVFTLAAKLSFSMLEDALQNSYRSEICPYVTLLLTFLGSMTQSERAMRRLERFIPWARLADFFSQIPDSAMYKFPNLGPELSQTATSSSNLQFRLTSFPLLEDWCLRGMGWTGKNLFGRGFWRLQKNFGRTTQHGGLHPEIGEQSKFLFCNWNVESEIDVLVGLSGELETNLGVQPDEMSRSGCGSHSAIPESSSHGQKGVDETHDRSESINIASFATDNQQKPDFRWKRVGLIAAWITRSENRLVIESSSELKTRFVICRGLKRKLERWQEEEQAEREKQRVAQLQKSSRSRNIVEIDEEIDQGIRDESDEDEDDDEDDPDDSELVRSLKARRRELRNLLRQSRGPVLKNSTNRPPPSLKPKKPKPAQSSRQPHKSSRINALPGYTILVLDTNILIGMLSKVKALLESEQFTIIVPLVVITELDGLKKGHSTGLEDGDDDRTQNQNRRLAEEAFEAIKYLEISVKTRSKFIKVQTSKGNYLRDLSIRSEELDLRSKSDKNELISTNAARNLDDIVLRATRWQLEHFSGRLSNLSNDEGSNSEMIEKVVLVTMDRNLRLKARARGIFAADEKCVEGLIEEIQSSKKRNGKNSSNNHKAG